MTASTVDTRQPTEFVIGRVGVVGLGHMGHDFAVNTIEDGHQVFVYDRDPTRAAAVGALALPQSSPSLPPAMNLVKLAANVLTATTLECMGEVLTLMRKGGVDAHLAFDVLTNSLFDSRVHKSYGEKIIDGRYSPPGMAAPLAVKDLRLALAEAERAAVPIPAASLVHDRLVHDRLVHDRLVHDAGSWMG